MFLKKILQLAPAFLLCAAGPAFGIERLPLPAQVFEVGGHRAFVIEPENNAVGSPWVWYAPTLVNLPDQSHRFYFEQFLAAGIAVAGYAQGEVRGSEQSSARFSRFYAAMRERGYAAKPVLLGQSRGGLMLLCWAFRNPDKVGAFAGIYPVCNLTSWPLQRSRAALLRDYAMTEEEILARLETLNPPHNLAGLAGNKVPLFLLTGDADEAVPHTENSLLVQEAYEELGGRVTVKIVPGGGHTGGSAYFEEQALADFVLGIAAANPLRQPK